MPIKVGAPGKLSIVRAKSLEGIPWLVHGFSTRVGGFSKLYGGNALNLGFTRGDSRADVERNREAFLKAVGAICREQQWPLVTLRQVHSDLIHRVSGVPEHPVGDGWVTNTPGVLLAVQTADCLPVVLVDTRRRAIGVLHAGWRGTIKRIVEKGVGEMRRWFESQPQDIRAAIGPGIHKCCYEVGEEVPSKFESQFAYAADLFHEIKESDPIRDRYPLLFLSPRPPGHSELPRKLFLDLVEANRRQLLAVGVTANRITASELCTACRQDILFSHRAEHGKTGRLLGVAGIRG